MANKKHDNIPCPRTEGIVASNLKLARLATSCDAVVLLCKDEKGIHFPCAEGLDREVSILCAS